MRFPAMAVQARVDLRNLLGPLLAEVSDRDLARFIRHCRNDEDLAATALTMLPRPAWVTGLVGKHPDEASN
jgi:hypothetical protein